MNRTSNIERRPPNPRPAASFNVRGSRFKVRGLGVGCSAVALLLLCWPDWAWGQLGVLQEDRPLCVFSGEGRKLRVLLRNSTAQPLEVDLRTRLLQASSATVMPTGPAQPWKRLTVLARQTVVQDLTLDFPSVRAETRFLLDWLDDRDHVLGRTEVHVHPDDLLKGLAARAGDEPVGVLDPDDLLKPILTRLKVVFHDLETGAGLDGFHGRLAIIGPFNSERTVPSGIGQRLKARAKQAGVWIWIQPPGPRGAGTFPSVRLVPCGLATVAVVHPDLVADLADSPRAQLDLLRCIDWAQHPERVRWPEGKRGEPSP